MSYVPFARKYRPQTFEELTGQSHVTSTLTRAVKGKRVAQAYLFAGQRGVGKTSAARILAKSLNCEQGSNAQPCNRCASCNQITQGRSLDVIEIDGASNRGIDEIRSLRETVPFAPASGAFRVYIIDEVHMLTTEAFNALLKTLEEPPAHVKFVFATTAANKIPATILSRCQRFDFRRLDSSTIVEVLTRIAKAEKLTIDEPALYAIARAAEGSLRDAEVILEQLASFVEGQIGEANVTELLGAVESDALLAWSQAILDRDAGQALHHLTIQLEQGKDPVQLLVSLLQHLRNLLVVRSVAGGATAHTTLERLIDEPAERLKQLRAQAEHATPQELLMILQLATGAYELVRRSPMAQMILEMVIIKLATREEWTSLDQIARQLEQGGNGEAGGSAPVAAGAPVASTAPPAPAQASTRDADDVEAPVVSASTVAAANKVPEPLTAIWPTFLERLGKKKMSLAAYLAESKPMKREGNKITIGMPGFALHQEVLTELETHRLIEGVLSELCQVAVTIEYATLSESELAPARDVPSAEPEDTPEIVQDIVKLFNAKVIDKPGSS